MEDDSKYQNLDEVEFNRQYGFTNLQIITVVNPTKKDFEFQITIETGLDPISGRLLTEARHYVVQAGKSERFPGVVARMYLDQMSKILAQQQDMFKLFADFATRAKFWDKLIVDQEDMLSQGRIGLQPFEDKATALPEVEEVPFGGVKDDDRRTAKKG